MEFLRHMTDSEGTDLLDTGLMPLHRKHLRLGLLHYHLKPGGVASVMRDIAVALDRYSPYETPEIDIIASGANERVPMAFAGISDRTRLRAIETPSLAYRDEPYPDKVSFLEAAEALAHDLLRRIDLSASTAECPYILHAHNISLGKNPVATMAFKRLSEIAAQRSLPLWLINQVHDFAEDNRPDRLKAFFTCTGQWDEEFARSFMYPVGPNVLYLTINSADIEKLAVLGIPGAFVLPDPVDVTQFEQKPLWEMSAEELRSLALPSADYKAVFLGMLHEYALSTHQQFAECLPILLSPMKVMRRKNNAETLLLLMLCKRLGREYQLLITLDANSAPDIKYSKKLKNFAKLCNAPVLIGFGATLLSGTNERTLENGSVKQFNMCDLHALAQGIVSTSIGEGFGLVYHEGWLSRKVVVGRKLPDIVGDFERSGMSFDHMYDRLAVSFNDVHDLRSRLVAAYERRLSEWREAVSSGVLNARAVVEAKIFKAGNEECVDFADLSLEMQFEFIDRVSADSAAARRFLDRNPALETSFRLLLEGAPELIEGNRAVIHSKYSLRAMARRLRHLFEIGDAHYKSPIGCELLTAQRHAALFQKFRNPGNARLII
ncbi:MAG: hypothetical protein Kow0099_36840 [Candidatus Abyssubacteria bacterium]